MNFLKIEILKDSFRLGFFFFNDKDVLYGINLLIVWIKIYILMIFLVYDLIIGNVFCNNFVL